jgi:hypothetical protein
MKVINALVEGIMDESVAIHIIKAAGHIPGAVYGRRGCGYIKEKIRGFNQAAQGAYYLTMVDFMDTHLGCPPDVVSSWLPHPNPSMVFRVVERELESWLLADRENIAKFLCIGVSKVPNNPEQIPDPKQALVNLARKSRSKYIRSALVPTEGSTAQVGRLYASEMIHFVQNHWDVQAARQSARSLDKCLTKLGSLETPTA